MQILLCLYCLIWNLNTNDAVKESLVLILFYTNIVWRPFRVNNGYCSKMHMTIANCHFGLAYHDCHFKTITRCTISNWIVVFRWDIIETLRTLSMCNAKSFSYIKLTTVVSNFNGLLKLVEHNWSQSVLSYIREIIQTWTLTWLHYIEGLFYLYLYILLYIHGNIR